MNAEPRTPKLHPVLWTAAVSVTVASLVAVAAMTGLLPKSQASNEATAAANPPAAVAAASTVANTASAKADTPVAPAKSTRHAAAAHEASTPAVARTSGYDSDAYAASRGLPPPTPLAQAEIPPAPTVCNECGVIESVHAVTQEGEGSGLGAVAGGVLGGALGNGIGQGNGRTLATIAGIVGGAFAGNKVEKNSRQTTHYEVTVRFDDGTRRTFTETMRPPWREGERVRLSNGSLTYVS